MFQAWFGFRNIGRETQVSTERDCVCVKMVVVVVYIYVCMRLNAPLSNLYTIPPLPHSLIKVDDIIGEEQQKRVVTKLHEILRPFLLRRMKRDVMITMPPKREIVVYCSMSSLQVRVTNSCTWTASQTGFIFNLFC